MIVAVILLSVLALLCLLALGLVGMTIKSNGRLVIDSTTAAIPPKLTFHVEYRPPDQPALPTGAAENQLSGKDSAESSGTAALPPNAESRPGGDRDVT